MNKKLLSLLFSLITCFFLIEFLNHSELLIQRFYQSISLWFYNLLPNIFIFFTITDILNNYHFPYFLEKIFGKIIHKIYKLPKICSYVIFMSMTTGFPGNSKLIKELLDNNNINIYDGTRLLIMTHFSNPLFITYTIGINYLHSKKIGIIILIVHFITNFIIGYLFRNIYTIHENNYNIKYKKSLPFMTMLKQSIDNTINVLLNILGIIIFFSIITTVINQYLNLNIYSNTILNGLLEITKGLNLLNELPINIIKKATIGTFFISFGGLSIHLQIFSILNKYKLNYIIYLLARIIHAALSAIIVYIILINYY